MSITATDVRDGWQLYLKKTYWMMGCADLTIRMWRRQEIIYSYLWTILATRVSTIDWNCGHV